MKKKNKESKIIFLILLILFTVFLILPVFRLLLKSFWGEEGPTLAHYSGVIFSGGFGKALGNSFLAASVSALITTVLALSLIHI